MVDPPTVSSWLGQHDVRLSLGRIQGFPDLLPGAVRGTITQLLNYCRWAGLSLTLTRRVGTLVQLRFTERE